MKIEDIAKLAGVSKSAVSLALNGKQGVSEQTRSEVLKIAKEVGYKHKSMLDEIKNRKMKIRFLVITDTSFMQKQYEKMPFFSELIQHVQQQCMKNDFEMILSSMELQAVLNGEFEYGQEDQDGVILLGTNLTAHEIELLKQYFEKIVVLDTLIPELETDFVVMNNKMGTFQAIDHLKMLGHTNIGYIKSVERIANLEERYESFKLALKKFSCSEQFEMFSSSSNKIGIDKHLQEWYQNLNEAQRPTALFCENDYLAISTIKSLMTIGVSIPDDIAVVGFDDISEAIAVTPELTTIHVNKEQMAITAVRRLKAIIDAQEISVKIMIDTKLIARNSTTQLSNH